MTLFGNIYRAAFTEAIKNDKSSTFKQTLRYNCPWAHFVRKDGVEYICITDDVECALKTDTETIIEDLNECLNWDIKTIKLNGEPQSAIVIPYDDFCRFIYPEVELLD